MDRRFTKLVMAKGEQGATKSKATRHKATRSFTYRGVHFVAVPSSEAHVKLYTVLKDGEAPLYQCTVEMKNLRKAAYALAKALLAERELAGYVVE